MSNVCSKSQYAKNQMTAWICFIDSCMVEKEDFLQIMIYKPVDFVEHINGMAYFDVWFGIKLSIFDSNSPKTDLF